MKNRLLLALIFIVFAGYSQVVTTNPTFPIVSESVTITFNAAEGNKGLMNFTGDIYAHAGLITSESANGSDWKYVIAAWDENTEKAKLKRVSANMYTFEINPSIIDFYSVATGVNVLQLAFVFRSADGTKTGKTVDNADIFIDVYSPELSASILKPAKEILVKASESIEIQVASNYADSLILYIDNKRLASTNESELNKIIQAENEGVHWIWIEAKDAQRSVYDSVKYFVRNSPAIAELPSGARKGINYENDSTVTLVLYAPEKDFVYLIGDFNNWDYSLTNDLYMSPLSQVSNTTWLMNITPDSDYHWMTLTNLEAEKEYAFQYFVDGKIRLADPYAEMVLDPWNDSRIANETYPGLKPYPVGKTTEPAAVFQTAQKQYEWQATDFEMPAEGNMVIYEMLIRDFVATHSYKTIADTLDYLVRLGVNVLELMPVNEFEGNSSWGYNPSFYFAPDKYYGPRTELKKLVDECHKRGIAVLIDMVLNHSYGQSPLVRLYFENGKPAANNPWYNMDHNFKNPDAHWGYDFNHESLQTQELVDSINSFWLTQYNVDGFRFDFTKGFSNTPYGVSDWGSAYDADRIRILKRMADEIWRRKPQAFISCEHLSDNVEEKELANYGLNLWGNMNGKYNEATMGYNEGDKSDLSRVSYKSRGWDNPNLVAYMESHDEERLMVKNLLWGNSSGSYDITNVPTALKRLELAANFFLPIPGPKMIWQFGELGYDISIDENGRVGEKPILWHYYDDKNRKRIYEVYAALNQLKLNQPAFTTSDFSLNVSKAIKTIQLNHSDMNVMIIGNFDVVPQTVNAQFQNAGTWYEFYSGKTVEVQNNELEMTLNPGDYYLYTTKQLEIPEVTPQIEFSSQKGIENLLVYPNPASKMLYIANNEQFEIVTIQNILGQKTEPIQFNEDKNEINISNLPQGIYVLSGIAKTGLVFSTRFIKN